MIIGGEEDRGGHALPQCGGGSKLSGGGHGIVAGEKDGRRIDRRDSALADGSTDCGDAVVDAENNLESLSHVCIGFCVGAKEEILAV